MISGRHQIISCPLRRRTGEDRCGNLHESQSVHSLTKFSHNLTSHHNILLHIRVTQIQITVFQTRIFVCFPGLIYLKRKSIVNAFTQNLNLIGNHLNFSGRQFHIFVGTLPDNTLHGNGGLLVDTVHDSHHFLGLHH